MGIRWKISTTPAIAAIAVCLCAPAIGIAQADKHAVSESEKAQLRLWAQELDADAFQRRNDATDALIKAGRPGIPFAAEAARDQSPEAVHRAFRVLIEGALADDEILAVEAKAAIADLAAHEKGLSAARARQALRYVENYLVITFEKLGGSVRVDDAGRIVALSCDNTAVTDLLLRRLARTTTLTYLSLAGTQISDDGLQHLQNMKQLKVLSLARTAVTDAGLKQLQPLGQLEYLGLRGTKVTDDGLQTVAGFRRLKGLHLGDTAITSRGIAALKPLAKLDFLRLRGTKIGDEAIEPLSELAALRRLDVGGTAISDAGVARLREKLPVSTRPITRDEDRE
jgi:Leucine Rich Repeat (LRR) protein